jgi:energy-coupling factor transporter transmembrane protein EcfT
MYLNRLEIQHDTLKAFDPRARLAAGIALLLVAVNAAEIALLSGMIAVCLFFLRRDLPCAVKRLAPLEMFCLLFLAQAACGLLKVQTALIIALRVNSAALIYMLTVIPLGTGTAARTLAALHVNQKLVSILYLSCRYIYLMHDKVFFSVKAMRLRLNPGQKGSGAMWKSYAAVFAASLAGAFVQADAIGMALRKRGFDGVIPETVPPQWGTRDTVLIIGCSGGLLLYGAYRIWNI